MGRESSLLARHSSSEDITLEKHEKTAKIMRFSSLGWWYRLTAPPEPHTSASLSQREAFRRGQLLSSILLIVILLVSGTAIGLLTSQKLFLTILALLLTLLFGAFLNRKGHVLASGILLTVMMELAIVVFVLLLPGGLSVFSLPMFDIFVYGELFAVSFLPAESVLVVAGFNILFIITALILLPKNTELLAIIHSPAIADTLARPVALQVVVASVTYLWVRSANHALKRWDRTEELNMMVQKQKGLLEEVDRLYQQQAKAAETDVITNLPNHRAVVNRIEEKLAHCMQAQATCAVLFLDLDHFKQINDTKGHCAGDAVLHEVAMRLRNTLPEEDFVGRYGGEEFAVVLTHTDMTEAAHTAERLRTAIAAQPCLWQAEYSLTAIPIPVTTSIGVALYGLHGVTRTELVEHADHAMYRAKQTGRNRVCIADLVETSSVERAIPEHISLDESSIVQVLTATALAHDRGTHDHAQRMVILAEATARVLHRSEEEVHLVQLGAQLHDIGKIGIPDAILHKPGPLTDAEWNVMRQHPTVGQYILSQSGSGILGALAQVIVAHHERWDGRGYPNGLAGEAIPLAARILAVIDSYDAMTSRRAYRDPTSSLAARKELERCAGSQYDPAVVTAFLHVLDTHDILGNMLLPLNTEVESAV